MKSSRLRNSAACVLFLTLTVQPAVAYAVSGQALASGAAGSTAAAGSAASQALGHAAVGQGTDQMNQGQQTQNMAQMAAGAMQIAQGLLGLLAGANAGNQANQDAANQSALTDLGNTTPVTTGGTSLTSDTTSAGSSSTGSPTSSSQVGISASELRTGTLGQAMNGIEQNYGIPRDQFAAALQAGTSPQDILSHAPKNAPSADLLNKIAGGLAASNAAAGSDAAARILASVDTSSSNAGAGTGAVDLGKASTASSAKPANNDDALDELTGQQGLSPEVKAAMAAKIAAQNAEKERLEAGGWNIFQLVHSRYQKLETMLYGRVDRTNVSPTGAVKGF